MKAQIVLLVVCLSLLGCSRESSRPSGANRATFANPQSASDLPETSSPSDANMVTFRVPRSIFDETAASRAYEIGFSSEGVRTEVGKFILAKREGADAALKLTERTHPAPEDNVPLGAKYECFVFEKDDYSHFRKYIGEVHSPHEGGAIATEYVECDTFRFRWSIGDWITYGDSIIALARTDKTDIKDVNFADPKLEWHYRKKPGIPVPAEVGTIPARN
jgi:hypothetical protein